MHVLSVGGDGLRRHGLDRRDCCRELWTHLQQQRDEPGPTGLVRCAEPSPGVPVEELVELQIVAKIGIGLLDGRASPIAGRRPLASRKKREDSRRASSTATSPKCNSLPEPTGHSTWKSSP